MYYSPLRYPGGKRKLASLMKFLIEKTNHLGGIYIEPFAGGAGIAFELLENNIVNQIVINDLDIGIYSFWRAAIFETKRFLDKMDDIPITIDEWYKQREIIRKPHNEYSFDLGFAIFFMNRTNRSGIINGGVIGGFEQTGKYKIDARFNKKNLKERIEKIAGYRNRINIYNKDIADFITTVLPDYEDNAFVYFDPPYFEKGKELYLNFFNYNDHVRIENMINNSVNCDWVITYDNVPEIADIYVNHEIRRFDLNYSAAIKRKASEIMIFKNKKMIPTEKELVAKEICINYR